MRNAAGYLHDTLLLLQKYKQKNLKKDDIPVLVAANKQDLFTALPPGSVRDKLEVEIEKIRTSRSKGLLDPTVGTGVDREEDEEEPLGGGESQERFSFKMLGENIGIKVDVVGGAVKDDGDSEVGSGVRRWEEWIGSCL